MRDNKEVRELYKNIGNRLLLKRITLYAGTSGRVTRGKYRILRND